MAEWNDWETNDWEEIKSSPVPKQKVNPQPSTNPVAQSSNQETADWNEWNSAWDDAPPSEPISSGSKGKSARVPRATVPKKKPSGRTILMPATNSPNSSSPEVPNHRVVEVENSAIDESAEIITQKADIVLSASGSARSFTTKFVDLEVAGSNKIVESSKAVHPETLDSPTFLANGHEENLSSESKLSENERKQEEIQLKAKKKADALLKKKAAAQAEQDRKAAFEEEASLQKVKLENERKADEERARILARERENIQRLRQLKEAENIAAEKLRVAAEARIKREAEEREAENARLEKLLREEEERTRKQLEAELEERRKLEEIREQERFQNEERERRKHEEVLEERRRVEEIREQERLQKEKDERERLKREEEEKRKQMEVERQQKKQIEEQRIREQERLEKEAEIARLVQLEEETRRKQHLEEEEQRRRLEEAQSRARELLETQQRELLEKQRVEERRLEEIELANQRRKMEEKRLADEERRQAILRALEVDLREESFDNNEARKLEEAQNHDAISDPFQAVPAEQPFFSQQAKNGWPISESSKKPADVESFSNHVSKTTEDWGWNEDSWDAQDNSTLENEVVGGGTSHLSKVEVHEEGFGTAEERPGKPPKISDWPSDLPTDTGHPFASTSRDLPFESSRNDKLTNQEKNLPVARRSLGWDELSLTLNHTEDVRSSTFVEHAETSHFSGFGAALNGESPLQSEEDSDEEEDPDDVLIDTVPSEPIYFEAGKVDDHRLTSSSDLVESIPRISRSEGSSSRPDDPLHRFDADLRDAVFGIPSESRSSESDYRQREETDHSSQRSYSRSGSYDSYSSEPDVDGQSHFSGETVDSNATNWTVTEPMEKIMRAFGPIPGLQNGAAFGLPLPSLGSFSLNYPYGDYYSADTSASVMPEFFPTFIGGNESADATSLSSPFFVKHLYPYSTGTLGADGLVRVDNFAPPVSLESYEVKARPSSVSVIVSRFPHNLLISKPEVDEKLSSFCRMMAETITDFGSLDNSKREEALLWNLLSLLARYGSSVRNFAVSEVLMAASRDPCIAMSSTSLFNGQSQSESYPGEKKLASVRRSLAAGLIPRACRAAEENGRTPLSFMLLSLPSVTKTNNKSALEGFLRYLDKTVSPSDPIYTACSLMCGGSPKLSECVKNWSTHVAVTIGCGVLIPSAAKTKFLLTLADMMESCGKYAARDVLYLLSRPSTRVLNKQDSVLIGSKLNIAESRSDPDFVERNLDKIHLTEAFVYVANKLNPAARSTFSPFVQFLYLKFLLDKSAKKEAGGYFGYFVGDFLNVLDASSSSENSVLLLELYELCTAHQRCLDGKGHDGHVRSALTGYVVKFLDAQRHTQVNARIKESERLMELKFRAEAAQIEMENRRRETEWSQANGSENHRTHVDNDEDAIRQATARSRIVSPVETIEEMRQHSVDRVSPVVYEQPNHLTQPFSIPLFVAPPVYQPGTPPTQPEAQSVVGIPHVHGNTGQDRMSPGAVVHNDNFVDKDWEDEHLDFYKLKKHESDSETSESSKKHSKSAAYAGETGFVEHEAFPSRRSSNVSGWSQRERTSSAASLEHHSASDYVDEISPDEEHSRSVDPEDLSGVTMHFAETPGWNSGSDQNGPPNFQFGNIDQQRNWSGHTDANPPTSYQEANVVPPTGIPETASWYSEQAGPEVDAQSQLDDSQYGQYTENSTNNGSVQQYYWITNPADGNGYNQTQGTEYGHGNNAEYSGNMGESGEAVQDPSAEAKALQEQWDAYYAAVAAQQNGFSSEYQSSVQTAGGGDGVNYDPNYNYQATDQSAQIAYHSQEQQSWQSAPQTNPDGQQVYSGYNGYDYAGNYNPYPPAQSAGLEQFTYAEPEIPFEEDDEAGTPGFPPTPRPLSSAVPDTHTAPDTKQPKPGLMGRFTGFFKKSSNDIPQPAAAPAGQPSFTPNVAGGFAPPPGWQPPGSTNTGWSDVSLNNTSAAPPVFTSPLMYSANPASTPFNGSTVSGYQSYGQNSVQQSNPNQFPAAVNSFPLYNPMAPAQMSQLNADVNPGHKIPPLY